MVDCVICSIAQKKIKSFIIYEDSDFIAFLDIVPRVKGMAVVAPKEHVTSLVDYDKAFELMKTVLQITKTIKAKLNAKSVIISNLPTQSGHLIIKLYPIKEDTELPLVEKDPIRLDENELIELLEKLKIEEIEEDEKKKIQEKDVEYLEKLKQEWEFT